MKISLAPEVEARLARIASEEGKSANQVVQELVATYLDHDEWFRQEVQNGLAPLDGGRFVSHEEVGGRRFDACDAAVDRESSGNPAGHASSRNPWARR